MFNVSLWGQFRKFIMLTFRFSESEMTVSQNPQSVEGKAFCVAPLTSLHETWDVVAQSRSTVTAMGDVLISDQLWGLASAHTANALFTESGSFWPGGGSVLCPCAGFTCAMSAWTFYHVAHGEVLTPSLGWRLHHQPGYVCPSTLSLHIPLSLSAKLIW